MTISGRDVRDHLSNGQRAKCIIGLYAMDNYIIEKKYEKLFWTDGSIVNEDDKFFKEAKWKILG